MLSICLMFTMVSLSYIAFIETSINNSPVFINICDWFSGAYITTSITFSFDSLTVSMLIPIITVSF
jgi:NADH-ubiquinone oxidoreductase chain 5